MDRDAEKMIELARSRGLISDEKAERAGELLRSRRIGDIAGFIGGDLVAEGVIALDEANTLLSWASQEAPAPPPNPSAFATRPADGSEQNRGPDPKSETVDSARPGAPKFVHGKTLGRGGMGLVTESFDPDLRRDVAVKTLLNPKDEQARRRFLEEAQVTGQLEHPNIIPVHELGLEGGRGPFLVMKRVRGRSLREVIDDIAADRPVRLRISTPGTRAGGKPATGLGTQPEAKAHAQTTPLPAPVEHEAPDGLRDVSQSPEKALAWLLGVFVRVCEGVAYAHSRGVIHRDLKPENIMVGEFGEVLVMDWGLAKAVGVADASAGSSVVTNRTENPSGISATLDGSAVGTPSYMPPEQARGDVEAMDARSDVYGLGAILYELLSLNRPVDGDTVFQILARVERGQVEPPCRRTKAPWDIPRELEAVVMKAMALNPAERYAGALELRDEVEAFFAGRRLRAAAYSPWEIMLKWARRNRAAVSTGIGMAVLLAAATVVFVVSLAGEQREALRQRDAARTAENEAISQRGAAEAQRREAEAQRTAAETQRTRAEELRVQAELRAAHSLVLEGNALLGAKRWSEAVERYERAEAEFGRLGVSTEPARLGLLDAHQANPPPLYRIPLEPGDGMSLAYSPDGRMLLSTGSGGGPATLQEAATGKVVRSFENSEKFASCTFAPDGTSIFFRSEGDAVQVETATGTVIRTYPKPGPGLNADSIALSRDGTRLLLGHSNGDLTLWDTASGTMLKTLTGHRRPVISVALSQDGKRALSGSHDSYARVWDLDTGATIRVHGRMPNYVFAVAFLGSSDRVATGGASTLKIWGADGSLVREIQSQGGFITSLDVTPDGRLGLLGLRDGVAQLWNLDTGAKIRNFHGHEPGIAGVAFGPGSGIAATLGGDGIRVWNPGLGAEPEVMRGHLSDIRALAVSGDGSLALTSGDDGWLRLWDVEGALCLRKYRTIGGSNFSVAFLQGDRLAAAGGPDGTVRVIDLDEGTMVQTLKGHRGLVMSMDVSPDGSSLLVGDQLGFLHLWDTTTWEVRRRINAFPDEKRIRWVGAVRFFQDGKKAVASSADCTARVVDLDTGRETIAFNGHRSILNVLDISPDGRTVASGGFGPDIRIWDAETGIERFMLGENRLGVGHFSFTRDGRRLISTSGDYTLKIWDALTGQGLHTLRGGVECFGRFFLLPGGERFVATRSDNTLFVWDFRKPERIREIEVSRADAVRKLAGNPSDAGALLAFGEASRRQGAWAWAIEYLKSARENGADVDGLMLARSLWKEGRIDEALLELQAEADRPRSKEQPRARLIGRALKGLGEMKADREEAAGFAEKATHVRDGLHRGVLAADAIVAGGTHWVPFRFDGMTSEILRLEMKSAAFTPVFIVLPPDGAAAVMSVQPGSDPDTAACEFRLQFPGTHVVLCGSRQPEATGEFTLALTRN